MHDFFTFSSLKYRFGRMIPLIIFTAASAYFIWNLKKGHFGQDSYNQEVLAEQEAKDSLDKAKLDEANWQHRIDSLSNNALDKDLLDERARIMLNNSAPDEVIIPLKPEKSNSN